MKRTKLKEIAKELLLDGLAGAYYIIGATENTENLTKEEEIIFSYIQKFGRIMSKSIGKEYYTM